MCLKIYYKRTVRRRPVFDVNSEISRCRHRNDCISKRNGTVKCKCRHDIGTSDCKERVGVGACTAGCRGGAGRFKYRIAGCDRDVSPIVDAIVYDAVRIRTGACGIGIPPIAVTSAEGSVVADATGGVETNTS
jgi:hypothetical protein